jgi:prepilin-type N-terminal cleavage/methylation domain-containing protein
MKFRPQAKGFTLIELLVTTGLMVIFIVAVWHLIRNLALASSRTGRDAVELSLAVRMSARFRDDVRQAVDATVNAEKSSVRLDLGKSTVQYRRGTEGRLERLEGEQLDSGPVLHSIQFEFSVLERLVHSRWVCGDDRDDERIPREARLEERVLLLDTKLRSASVEGKSR